MTGPRLLVTTISSFVLLACISWKPMAYTDGPYGQLVALGSDGANTVALVTIQMTGSVYVHWNRTFPDDFLTSQCQFGFDIENSVIYLPSMYEVVGLDAGSGNAVVNYYTQQLVYFYSFNYDYVNKSVKGICSGRNTFNWCRMEVSGDMVGSNTYEFMLPDTQQPEMCNYDTDFVNQTMWYHIGSRVMGIDLHTGQQKFEGVSYAHCIAYDWKTGKVFGVAAVNGSQQMGVVQIKENGTNQTIATLPQGYQLEFPGVCEIHAESRSMFILMTKNVSMLSNEDYSWALLKVNLTSSQTALTPLDRLPTLSGSTQQLKITHFKFLDEHV